MVNQIGITEGADPTVNTKWVDWVKLGKPAILITKMPRLLLPMLTGGENVIIHCTITGMGGTDLEPGIDKYVESLDYYHRLCDLLGKERVVLRIDPIFNPARNPLYQRVLDTIYSEKEDRLRISFLDLYDHVQVRLKRHGIEVNQTSFHLPLGIRLRIWEHLGRPEVCAEPKMPSTPCVSEVDCRILGVGPSTSRRGQRSACNCLANKKELCYPPPKCTYGCLYCYWKS